GKAPWYWTGATMQFDGGWMWPDGKVVQDSAWATGEPNGDGKCAHLENGGVMLYDGPCTIQIGSIAICQGDWKGVVILKQMITAKGDISFSRRLEGCCDSEADDNCERTLEFSRHCKCRAQN
ncbi:unnamed protein product, partial [Meganyctiphanes norvegica]